jgi:methylmalonyl-CoA/ethylmalonyl-CoA epimerase
MSVTTTSDLNASGERTGGMSSPIESPSALLRNSTLHHLGVVVASISRAAEDFAACMSAKWDGEIIHDPLQQVRVAFFRPIGAGNPVFELVEPASESSPVTNFLSKRVGLHHVCYETDDLEAVLEAARAAGLFIVSTPRPAVAFGGRRIAWVSSKNRLLMEFLERKQK